MILKKIGGEKPLNWMTYQQKLSDWEKTNLSSRTVPGMSMTIDEMIARHQKGLPIDESKGSLYREGEEPLQNLEHMDLVDRQAYIDSVADTLVEVRARIEANAKTKAERQFVDKVDLAVKQQLAEMRLKTNTPEKPAE